MDSLLQWCVENKCVENEDDGTQTVHLRAIIAKCLNMGSIHEDRVYSKISTLIRPIRQQINVLTIANGGGRPRRASIETILTQIFPLLVPKHTALQSYVNLLNELDEAVDAEPSDDTPQFFTLHAKSRHPCIIRRDRVLVHSYQLRIIARLPD